MPLSEGHCYLGCGGREDDNWQDHEECMVEEGERVFPVAATSHVVAITATSQVVAVPVGSAAHDDGAAIGGNENGDHGIGFVQFCCCCTFDK